MSVDERPLRRSIRVKFQLVLMAGLVVIFASFIMSQLREITAVHLKIESKLEELDAETKRKEQIGKEYDFIKDKEFIIQQGRDKFDLVMENDIVYIKRIID